jgi:hypothetical protein
MSIKRLGLLFHIVAALFIFITLSQAQVKDIFEDDGTNWGLDSGDTYNLGWVKGVIMGTSLVYNEIYPNLERMFKNKKPTEFYKTSLEYTANKMKGLTLIGITIGQIRDGIDVLYKDFSNRRIRIIDAIFVVKMQIEGKDADLIQAQLRYLRMHPINDKTYEAALDKISDLRDKRIEKGLFDFTNEDLKNGIITEQELLIYGTFVDKNNVNHNLFCYGYYK